MGLLNLFKSNQNEVEISATGLYSINGKNLVPINELPKTGSYYDIAESLGYIDFHGVIMFDSNKIHYIAFKRRTKEPIFVEVKDKTQPLSYSDITEIIQTIDWNFEWRQLDFEDSNT
jgi:hypothetical protein